MAALWKRFERWLNADKAFGLLCVVATVFVVFIVVLLIPSCVDIYVTALEPAQMSPPLKRGNK